MLYYVQHYSMMVAYILYHMHDTMYIMLCCCLFVVFFTLLWVLQQGGVWGGDDRSVVYTTTAGNVYAVHFHMLYFLQMYGYTIYNT